MDLRASGGLRDLVLEQGLPDSTGTGSLQPLPPHLGTPGQHLRQHGDKSWSLGLPSPCEAVGEAGGDVRNGLSTGPTSV